MARSGSPCARRHPGEVLDRAEDPSRGSFSIGFGGHGPFRQSQRGGFVAETHIGQREIVQSAARIFRLFFEERFQFAARLSPTFLRGSMVTGDVLRDEQDMGDFELDLFLSLNGHRCRAH